MQVADAFEVFPMLDGAALRAAVEKHKPDVIVPEIEAIDTATLAALESRRLARRALGQGGAADHEPRRHPRLRRARARPRHLAIPLRREPRRSDRRRRRGRPAVRRQAGDVELGQGPEHREDRGRGRRRLGLCGRQHARRPAARDRRGIHRLRQRDHLADRRDQGRRPVLRRRSATARKPATIAKAGSRRRSRARRCTRPATRRARSSRRSAATAFSGSNSSSAATRRSSPSFRPRPHDTGMVTLISQFPNEFELHLRAILGLPIPSIELAGPSASAVILASRGKRQLRLRRNRRSACARRARQARSTCGSSPSPRRSRTAAWALRWRAAKRRRCGRTRQGCSRSRPHSLCRG